MMFFGGILEELVNIMAESLYVMRVGQFKDKPIEDIPRWYLEAILDRDFFKKDKVGVEAVKKELIFRDRFGEP